MEMSKVRRAAKIFVSTPIRQKRLSGVSYRWRLHRDESGPAQYGVTLAAKRLTPESVKALYERHGGALAAYACSRGLDFASAEDLVQQIFMKLLEGRAWPGEEPVGYLYRAVRNASLNFHRDRRNEVELPSEEWWFTHRRADIAEIHALQQVLRELPEEQRETVFLKIWGGLTLQEIANATGTSLNTVASRYRYALGKLRDRLFASSVKD